ncbi:uncharacterized protein A4U43_C02F3730 [Asparagus officinalis]|uniref:NB-ARC domain-containing protein n=1 Tax=Asparagus officinalis TaxID=4686 RepID=A0A5P1FGD2_ASPOF|nr:uncharacterized protein A4U43_C02F3730 [Asparagus officinalis]
MPGKVRYRGILWSSASKLDDVATIVGFSPPSPSHEGFWERLYTGVLLCLPKRLYPLAQRFLGAALHRCSSKLESRRLHGVPNLQEVSFGRDEDITVFPNLMSLSVSECPRLKSLLGGLKGSPLKELDIHSCQSLKRIPHLPALTELSICFLVNSFTSVI